MRKKRGYQRDVHPDLLRDYKLFAIVCEGGKREPQYFRYFEHLSPQKIVIDIIEEKISDEKMEQQTHQTKSAPRWLLDRAVKYIEKEGLSDEDDLWFVMDTDRWSRMQIEEIASYCNERPNWHIILSNPCFEVWLYLCQKADIKSFSGKSCADFKHEISLWNPQGTDLKQCVQQTKDAIKNAKNIDSDVNHFYPNEKETKVYLLMEALQKKAGITDFDAFIEKIK